MERFDIKKLINETLFIRELYSEKNYDLMKVDNIPTLKAFANLIDDRPNYSPLRAAVDCVVMYCLIEYRKDL
jgi:hypothetical protein